MKFGIIGVGNVGSVHADNLFHNRLSGVRLGALADHDPAVLEKCAKKFPGVPLYLDYREMAEKEKLDAIVVATPHYCHSEMGIYLISHGINVLLEKPLAVTAKGAQEILDASMKNPQIKVGVSFNQRSNRVYQKAHEILQAKQLGTLRLARYEITDWYRPDSYYRMNPWRGSYAGEGGGCLINQCHHQLDLIQWFFGLPISVKARCQTIDRQIEGENDVLAILHYSTFDLILSASGHDAKGINLMDVSGDNGRLMIEKTVMHAYFHPSEIDVNAHSKNYGGCLSEEKIFSYGDQRLKEDKAYGQQLRSLRNFRNVILGKEQPLAELKEGLKDDQLLNAIYYSSWTSQEISIPLDPEVYERALEEKRAGIPKK